MEKSITAQNGITIFTAMKWRKENRGIILMTRNKRIIRAQHDMNLSNLFICIPILLADGQLSRLLITDVRPEPLAMYT